MFAALFLAAGASAATVRIAITGSVQTTAVAGGDPSIGISLAGVAGDLTYVGIGTSTGTITQTYPSAPIVPGATGPGASLNVFHGDVSQGCVRVNGNKTLVVGLLPANEQFDTTFGHIDGLGGLFQDNGAATGTPVDLAAAVIYRTTSRQNACDPTKPFPSFAPTALDSGDVAYGYTDKLDAYPANRDSDASVTNSNGLSVTITDEPDPAGLQVAVGAGSGFAEFDTCGMQVNVNAGSTAIFTCASLIAQVVTGSAEVVLDDALSSVLIPAGGKAEIGDDGNGGFTVENLGSEPITVIVDGVEATIAPGETSTVEAWDFQGFFSPVDPIPMNNSMKAGAAVPLKWRILDATGAPVRNLAAATISVSTLSCGSAVGSAEIEQTAAVGSPLQNLGNGYYQLNWKTAKAYAGSCKTLHLDVGDGVTHDAYFDFRK